MAEESGIRSGQFVGSGGLDITGSSGYGADFKTENEKKKSGWRKFVAHIGPGFLVAVASIDPGNFQSDLQAGAQYKYELLWIMLVATFSGLLIQSLAVNLGVVTGKHLSEHYREEYPLKLNYVLWLLSEIAVTTADIPEVLGTAFALNMLFHIPVWAGVLLAGLSTLVLLGMQKFGIRKLEALITLLVFTMFFCFVGELVYAKPNPKALLKGIFVPQLSGQGAVGLAISIIGSMLTPHNLFLQSALVLSRKVEPTTAAINSTCRYFLIETGIALFVAFLVNVSITSVSGAICSSPNLSPADLNNCANLSVNNSPFLLKHVLGKWSPTVFAVALLASGQSTSITGTYAGQYIMQGFLKMKMKTWLRNFMTRSIAIVPSLIVAVIYGSSGSGRLIIIASMILSFQLPYTLIPVLKFTSSEIKMGPHKNSLGIAIAAWLIGCYVTGINVYYLGSRFLTWLLHNNLPKVASAFIAVLGFPFLALYLVGILYLAFREDKKVTYIAPGGSSLPSPFSTPNPQHPERELESQGSSDSK